ncbi:uncharacterized protein FMAN_16149 [Fusarium mangiferae]|uniref:Uncharacterized protein n=1 Tax=Fusarium mangiferae TaxID=192010 RepID=A0A1L7TDL6_FUSMA|nr:uncharacterized protein FMAN_16149 [Fusarium mangiferae]CVK96788.1 uncharacterized protein FMAN_16149 [Fusarium mangiferae]
MAGKSTELLESDASHQKNPESPVAKSDVDSKKVMTPVARPVGLEEVATPHTTAVLLEEEKIWRRPSPIPSFSSSSPGSKDFWGIVNVILVATVASIVFLIAAFVFFANIAPPLFELTTLGKKTSSDGVAVHEAAAPGTHSLWKPHRRPVRRFTSASEATLSCLVEITSALVEFTQDIAGLLMLGRLNCQLEEYESSGVIWSCRDSDSRLSATCVSAVGDEWRKL